MNNLKNSNKDALDLILDYIIEAKSEYNDGYVRQHYMDKLKAIKYKIDSVNFLSTRSNRIGEMTGHLAPFKEELDYLINMVASHKSVFSKEMSASLAKDIVKLERKWRKKGIEALKAREARVDIHPLISLEEFEGE